MLIIPGNFKVPATKKDSLRITRIYVSQRQTTYNGRKLWNFPKHLARFEFTSPPTTGSASPPRSLNVAVYPPNPEATTPFFSATLTPFRFPPPLPFASNRLPLGTLCAQPPLPQAKEGPNKDVLVGTESWAEFTPVLTTSRARGCWVEMHAPPKGSDEEKEAEKWWPVSVKPWSIGLWFEEGTLDVGVPRTWQP